jgi:hypothetical protein
MVRGACQVRARHGRLGLFGQRVGMTCPAWLGAVGSGGTWCGMAAKARSRRARRVKPGPGRLGGQGSSSQGSAWRVMAGVPSLRQGMPSLGEAWHGAAGMACLGLAWCVGAWLAGVARQVCAGPGVVCKAGLAWLDAAFLGVAWQCMTGQAGMERHRLAWHGMAGFGRRGKSGHGLACQDWAGPAGRVMERRVMVWQGWAAQVSREGSAWQR